VSAEIEEMLRLYAQHQDTQASPVTVAEARARVEHSAAGNGAARAATGPDGPTRERAYLVEPPDHQMVALARPRAPRRRAVAILAAVAAVIVAVLAVVVTRPGSHQPAVVTRPHTHQPAPVAPAPLPVTTAPPPPPSGHLYWRDIKAIGRANLDGTNLARQLIPFNGQGAAPCVAVDRNHVYWPTGSPGAVARANRDGTGLDTSFIPDPSGGGSCVAVDGAHVYWLSGTTDVAIGRANLDGSDVNQDFVTVGKNDPNSIVGCDIAVDGAQIYWGNPSTGAIGRVNLDGTGLDPAFITGLTTGVGAGRPGPPGPCMGVSDGAHIYWANSDGTIGRANVDGTGVNNSFISLPVVSGGPPAPFPGGGGAAAWPIPCAHDSTYLYWADAGATAAIGRARLDGTDVEPDFITGLNMPSGCAVGP
jgi:hypothetical protein